MEIIPGPGREMNKCIMQIDVNRGGGAAAGEILPQPISNDMLYFTSLTRKNAEAITVSSSCSQVFWECKNGVHSLWNSIKNPGDQ